MAVDDRLSDLLVEWEQGRQNGDEPSLEELCRDTPDLLPVLRESIDSLRATAWMFQPEGNESISPEGLPRDSGRSSQAALHDTELPASHLTAQEFAASIFQSGLLSLPEIDELKKRLEASALPGEAREIASRLVTEGKLTRYQAAVLLEASKDPLLVDNYVILDTLETGGMGLVFKALHRSMNRVVALKLLPAAMMSARDTVKRFQREVQAAAALKHPNIVAAYDADESEEIAYLVLEYVEGTNLHRLVKDEGPRTLAQAADYVRQAARGLAYLHARGIIHRDVKPANLILARDGTVKLLDMGLVRFASSEDLSCSEMDQELTQAGIVIGTVAYMSPEQALDTRSADQRSDIYSLGCTLFFLLTGRSLYHEETGMKTLLAHREQPAPSIREFCEEAPVSLDAVFRTMVAKRPADRLQSMDEVIAALDSCVPASLGAVGSTSPTSPSVRAGESTPLRRAFRAPAPGGSRNGFWRDRRVLLGGAAFALVALAAAIVVRIKTDSGTVDVTVPGSHVESLEIHASPESGSQVGERGAPASRPAVVTKVTTNEHKMTEPERIGDQRVTIGHLAFCSKIVSYGDYVQLDRFTFAPGEAVMVYAEIGTPAGDYSSGSSRAFQGSTVEIRDQGDRLIQRVSYPPSENIGFTPRRGYYVSYRFELPAGLPPGLYALWLSVNERGGRRTARAGIGFAIKPTAAEPIGGGLNVGGGGGGGLRVGGGVAAKPAAWAPAGARPRKPLSVDRQVASWVLDNKGTIALREFPGRTFQYVEALPPTEFHIEKVSLRDYVIKSDVVSGGAPGRFGPRRPQPAAGGDPIAGTFHRVEFDTDDLKRLASLTELKELSFSSVALTDEGLARLRPLDKLEGLSLAQSSVTDEGLSAFVGMTRLADLDLDETAVTDAGLKQLARLKSLTDLGLVPERQQKGRELRKLPKLSLSQTRVTEAGIDELQRALPKCIVSASHLPGYRPAPPAPGSSDRDWAAWLLDPNQSRGSWTIGIDFDPSASLIRFDELPNVDFHIVKVDFNVSTPQLSRTMLHRMVELPKLDTLAFKRLPADALAGVGDIKQLQRLIIEESDGGDASLQVIGHLTRLKSLRLDDKNLTERGLAHLAPLRDLTWLALDGRSAGLRGTGLKSLAGLTHLASLNLSSSGLDDDGLKWLAPFQSLESLNLSGTWITGKGLPSLAALSHLKRLDLSGCPRLDSAMLSALAKCPRLESLGLNGCPLDERSAEPLMKLTNLRELYLENTNLSSGALVRVRNALGKCQVYPR